MAKNNNIQSIERAINIIDCFNSENIFLSLQEISKLTNLNISTTRGIVNTLTSLGLLNFDKKNKVYQLGLYFAAKTNLVSNKEDTLIAIVQPYAQKISGNFAVTCCFQLVQNLQICTIYSTSAHNRQYEIHVAEQALLPLLASASGKLCLYYNTDRKQIADIIEKFSVPYTNHTIESEEEMNQRLDEIGKKGYSYEDQEYQIGVSSVSVPILNADNQLVATLSTTSFSNHLLDMKDDVIESLKESAAEIEQKINDLP